MEIKNISRWEFEQLVPAGNGLEATIGDQVEWWTQKAGRFIGTIAKGIAEPGWRYILLERDANGGFRIHRRCGGIESLEAASLQLVGELEVTTHETTSQPTEESHA